MTQIDESAVRWRAGTGDDLVVAMHGFGSDENDIFAIAAYLPAALTVASLRGPNPGPFGGWSWFEFNPAVDNTDHTLIDESAQAVLAWLDGLDRQYARVHVFGFSQGGAMAVQLARLDPDRFASICHLSSFVHNGDLPGDVTLAAKQPKLPLFHGIGLHDTVIAADKRDRSLPWLDAHFEVQRHHYDRDHSIDSTEIADVAAFLAS